MLEDTLLIQRFNRGDRSAIRHICQTYGNDLLKVAAALLNDRSSVEDVVHDVFVDLAGAAEGLMIRTNLRSC